MKKHIIHARNTKLISLKKQHTAGSFLRKQTDCQLYVYMKQLTDSNILKYI